MKLVKHVFKKKTERETERLNEKETLRNWILKACCVAIFHQSSTIWYVLWFVVTLMNASTVGLVLCTGVNTRLT